MSEPNWRSRWWSVISTVVGAAFIVVVLLHGPGVAYAVVAVIGGMAYSIVGRLTRGGRK